MRTFVIVFTEPNQQGVAQLRGALTSPPYELVPNMVYLVKDSLLATNDLARLAGIKGDTRIAAGVVFRLGTGYAGFTKKALWEWLDEDE